MTAYELADINDWSCCAHVKEVSAMLRQQADRIAELENQLDKCSHYEAMAHQGGYEIGRASQIKELSDEEIEQIAIKWYVGSRILPIGFARAILKKASEK